MITKAFHAKVSQTIAEYEKDLQKRRILSILHTANKPLSFNQIKYRLKKMEKDEK
tara:strand:+ start:4799 stop:4963 length:165 start_codon:yes stop_codon:yes gene_type:complete